MQWDLGRNKRGNSCLRTANVSSQEIVIRGRHQVTEVGDRSNIRNNQRQERGREGAVHFNRGKREKKEGNVANCSRGKKERWEPGGE